MSRSLRLSLTLYELPPILSRRVRVTHSGPASRLTLAQAFYSPGDHYWADFWCIIYSGQWSCSSRREQIISAGTGNDDGKRAASRLSIAFLIIATPLIVMAIVCWSGRHWVKDRTPSLAKKGHAALLINRRLRFVVVSIFLYLDAAVTIGGGMANTSGWTAHCPRQH